ncbi:uncharacterized protein (TIGR01244 family) [Sphingobium sp. B1D7B]|uniref:protein tyrosine phosphatase family protein n=1 Tax=unclassified Sphingobium TaxID=2611147 RepID=UPI002224ED86|nr:MULTISPECIES: protein tyrosine phosphatase family protein [unclassified Sphingobium]MCW2390780.1 uncharacterized protein (TIGR01244 family) [Sphingobium sp. B11D3A]MCW2405922.1 uncharacterized protein (TIGR01244 family) [Sphingobium sp. B1D7B]
MADPDDIRNFLRVDTRITTSGRLQPGDPARLATIGVGHVINLALGSHPDALPNAAAEIAEAGLRYTHIPIPFEAPTEAHYRAFVAALEADDAPVHIHCIMNWRVSAFVYRYRRDALGIAEEQARALMTQIWDPADMATSGSSPDLGPWIEIIAPR